VPRAKSGEEWRGVDAEIHKVVCALLVVAIGAIAAVSAEDLAAAVKKRRDLMKKTVAPAAKLGGQMIKGVVPFDGTKAAKAMNDIAACRINM
jgi:cytochrome c556